MKLQNVWAIAQNETAIKELAAGAATLGENSTLVSLSGSENIAAVIPAIIEAAKTNKPDMILVEASRNGRLIAGLLAAAMGTAPLADTSAISVDGDSVTTKRMVYGGAAFKTEKATGTAIVICGNGLFEAGAAAANKLDIAAGAAGGIRFKEKKAKSGNSVNLGAAKKVVGVGRGLGQPENLELAQRLAAAIGAEVGCSRPVAEESKWLAKELYIGVSGVMMKPDIYIGVGISGQVQHMVGINQALTIVAINKDKNAPIFKQCDYGIVGDLEKVLPALAAKFGK
ncbi:MAG: electron transfer flavoprotein subunit alpha/FixB family protein [Deferribacteraceae bacterium]|jgi:electron transfer flavoprotein alpha subunit|nr:electron transfer flavoprotein subunit alpha/FixB family protein [Deferribacteraceae bacterium]